MKFKHNTDTFNTIYEAYYAGLRISWCIEGDYYRYTLTQSTLCIERKKTTYEYEGAVSYNVDQVYLQAKTGALVIKTTGVRPDFIFPPCEDE